MSYYDIIIRKLSSNRRCLGIFFIVLLTMCVIAVSINLFILSIGQPHIGVMLSREKQGWIITMVDTNALAAHAGMKVGDKPVEIDGIQAEQFLEKYEKDGVLFGQLITELTVIDADGQLKTANVETGFQSRESILELVAWLFVSTIFWIIGLYVFIKKPRNIAAVLLFLCSLLLGLALSANMAGERAIIDTHLTVIATSIGPWLLAHFFIVLPEERKSVRDNYLVYLIYLPALITIILFPIIGYGEGQPLPGFRTFRLFEYGTGFIAAAVIAIFNFIRAKSSRTRQQMKIVMISCIISLLPILLLNILPQTIWKQPLIAPGFSFLFFVFIPIGMGYAVVTQRLLDIDIVIRRGVVYGLITIIMATILSAAIFFSTAFNESLETPEQIIIALVLGGIATVLFGPIKRGVDILVDKLFYKDRYDYRQIISSLSTSLNLLKDYNEISRLIVGTSVRTLNLSGGCLLVPSEFESYEVKTAQGTFMDTNKQNQLVNLISLRSSEHEFPNSASTIDPDISFVIPIVAGEEEVGILCLSQKVTKQSFSVDDVYLIQGLASVSAGALHSASLIRDVSIRNTFVTIASHELRTPLTSVMGYAELLLRRNPPEETRNRWIKNIFDSSVRIKDIADDLLNVSRIQSGKVGIKLDAVKLTDIIEETLTIAKENSNKHAFIVNLEPDLPEILVDRDKFTQVIGNLLSNAIKYSPKGGNITLSAYSNEDAHSIVVSIADEGIGIDKKDKELLFTTFHRIQRPETQGIRGSGLGLYIVKEWTERMGGEVRLESELNKGSTFFIIIPASNSGAAEE